MLPASTVSTFNNLINDVKAYVLKAFEIDSTCMDDGFVEFTLSSEDMCGCSITVTDYNNDRFGIQIKPYVTNQWGDNIYFPTSFKMEEYELITAWFRQTFIYEIHYMKSFRAITQRIPNVAKDAGFEGLCLPSRVQHGQNENGIEYVTEQFELEDVFNGVKKKIEITVNAFKGKIFISTRTNGDWETISRDKDAKKALKKFKDRMARYIGQFDPHPRYYLMLLQDPTIFGEKVELFPLKNTNLED